MTVKELIEDLRKLKPEAVVWADNNGELFIVDGVHADVPQDGIGPSVMIKIL